MAREELLRVLGRPYLNLLADWYWLQAVQAAGIAYDRWTYRDIYFYGDMATQLDPQFRYAYQFTSTATTYNLGRETWVNIDESTAILEKGLQHFPNDVQLNVVYAFNLSYYYGRYAEAAEVLQRTMQVPGAPRYIGSLATRLFAQGGKVEAGLALATSMYESTQDPDQREQIAKRIQELLLERELQQIEAAALNFRQREQRQAISIDELVSSGDLSRPPKDPFGGEFFLTADGTAIATSQQRRLEIHREGQP